ncbi:hypothetical protein H6778_02535 [Candidatus Nomurabacteria bacterium]|nr:hypothetical protein [Candidatus Nomurabacteria bacterium]
MLTSSIEVISMRKDRKLKKASPKDDPNDVMREELGIDLDDKVQYEGPSEMHPTLVQQAQAKASTYDKFGVGQYDFE